VIVNLGGFAVRKVGACEIGTGLATQNMKWMAKNHNSLAAVCMDGLGGSFFGFFAGLI
jgi:hypothetical protein